MDELLPAAGLAMIFGASGCGKSFLTLDLTISIARGMPFGSREVQQGRVVYIAAEGVSGFRNRLRAYAIHHQLSLSRLQDFRLMTDGPNLTVAADVSGFIEAIRHFRADVVVIDTLAESTQGLDENSAQDIGVMLGHCRSIQQATAGLVILIHHSGKDSERGARGSSALRAAVDTEIEIVRTGDNTRTMRVTKQRDADDGAIAYFQLVPVALPSSKPVTSAIVQHMAAPTKKQASEPRGANERAVMAAVCELAASASDGRVSLEQVIGAAVARIPYDSNKKDRRREHVLRAIKSLVERSSLGFSDDWLRLPSPSGAEGFPQCRQYSCTHEGPLGIHEYLGHPSRAPSP